MKILFIGDIVGRPGRRAVARWLPALRETHGFDLVAANAENAAGGLGATPEILNELRDLGVRAFTLGNHAWRKKALLSAIDGMTDIVRPVNYPEGLPGRGAMLIPLADGRKVGLVNALGRVYMEPNNCPFAATDKAVAWLRRETPCVLVDIHAEATSEKVAMGWHLDGRVSVVLGTHTHVPTADAWVMPKGTAYITDVGMCGPMHSVIGTNRDIVLNRFLTGLPGRFEVAGGPIQFCAALIELDDTTGRAKRIEHILQRENSSTPQ